MIRLRNLARDVLVFGVADFLPKIVNFILLPVMTRVLKPSDYGTLSMVQFVSSIAETLYLFGADGAFARFFPERNTDERQNLFRSLSYQVFMQGLFGLLFWMAILPSAIPQFLSGGDFRFWPFGAAAVVLPLLYLPTSLPLIQARMEGRSTFYLRFRLGSFFVSILSILYFVLVKKQGAWGSVKGQLVAASLSCVTLIWLRRRSLFKASVDHSVIKKSLKYGYPTFLNSASGWLFHTSDRVFIQKYRDANTLGIYQMGYNFVSPLDFIINAINFSWMPKFFHSALDPEHVAALPKVALRLVSNVLLGLLAFMAILRPTVALFTASDFHIAFRVAEIMVFYYATRIFYCVYTQAIAVRDRNVDIAKVTLFSGFGNLVLNILLIPKGGAIGGAVATVLSGWIAVWNLGHFLKKIWPEMVIDRIGTPVIVSYMLYSFLILGVDFAVPSAWNPSILLIKFLAVVFFYVQLRWMKLDLHVAQVLSEKLDERKNRKND